MKSQKLMVMFAIVCLLVGASGTAMGVDRTCRRGLINNETVLGNVVVNGKNCHISESIIEGNITVINNPEDPKTFSMTNSRVLGEIKVTGTEMVFLKDVHVFDNSLTVEDSASVNVLDVSVRGYFSNSYMEFNGNTDEVNLFNNNITGNLLCDGNTFVVATGNMVWGIDTCKNQ